MKLLNWNALLCATVVFVGNGSGLRAQEQQTPRNALEVLTGGTSAASPKKIAQSGGEPVQLRVNHPVWIAGPETADPLKLASFVASGPDASASSEPAVPAILAGTASPNIGPSKPAPVTAGPLLPVPEGVSLSNSQPLVPIAAAANPGPEVPSILSGLPAAVDQPDSLLPVPAATALNEWNPAMALPQVTLMELKPSPVRQPTENPSSRELFADGTERLAEGQIAELVLQPIPTSRAAGNEISEPLELFEIERITASGQLGTDGKFSVSEMIGPMTDAGSLIARLNLENPYRNSATLQNSDIRLTNAADGYASFWLPTSYTWITPSFEHRPLYFEQPNLERYGVRPKPLWEPVVSASKFFGTVAVLPFRMMHHNPCCEVSTLGQQRPGECADYIRRSNGRD